MKKLHIILVVSVFSVFLVAGSVMATPISLSDTSLQDFFDFRGWSIDAENNQENMPSGWSIAETSSQAAMTLWSEGIGDNIAFGIYSLAGGELAEVFGTNDTAVASAAVLFLSGSSIVVQIADSGGFFLDVDSYSFSGTSFGFYIAEGTYGTSGDLYTNIVYSDPNLNDGVVGLLLYNPGPGQYVFAGDVDGNGDFSDIVAQAESISPVPEPATMMLFGSGLICFAFIGRKKLFNRG